MARPFPLALALLLAVTTASACHRKWPFRRDAASAAAKTPGTATSPADGEAALAKSPHAAPRDANCKTPLSTTGACGICLQFAQNAAIAAEEAYDPGRCEVLELKKNAAERRTISRCIVMYRNADGSDGPSGDCPCSCRL